MNLKIKILLTAFDPFGDDDVNSALETMLRLPNEFTGMELIKLQIPTVFTDSSLAVIEAIHKYQPDVVVMLGMAGGRTAITPERVAINLDDANIKDNAGFQPSEQPIAAGGPAAYFSKLPVQGMVSAMRAGGIPATISNTAGTFVCNHLMYSVLDHICNHQLDIIAGFIHLPYLPEQVAYRPGYASMSLDKLVEGIEICLHVISQTVQRTQ